MPLASHGRAPRAGPPGRSLVASRRMPLATAVNCRTVPPVRGVPLGRRAHAPRGLSRPVPGPAPAADRPGGAAARRRRAAHFLFRRCTRVLRSNLRCFFLAILLRRFLMTEPTTPPSLDDLGTTRHARARPTPVGWGHTPTLFY